MPGKTLQIIVTGLVQGVGFRPFVHRIALQHNLTGWVLNTSENVCIRISGKEADIERFIHALKTEAPRAAAVESVIPEVIPPEEFDGFTIRKSRDLSGDITEISPDIAVCSECLEDIRPGKRRAGYAFVNCTNCGPRFTIIKDLPYDRPKTTMKKFEMCPACRAEYENIADRRFHAQPTACGKCGPVYELYISGVKKNAGHEQIIAIVAELIDSGSVVMVKGLGGMHLACDAFNEKAVGALRELKNREGKPFAVMFRDMDEVEKYSWISPEESSSLLSWRRPIVLLQCRDSAARKPLAKNLNAGLTLAGIMLPYMPFHYQLFAKLETPAIVLTSGNFSSEPILISNRKALEQFSAVTGALILHNRDIHNRTDDSVVRVMAGKKRVLRRSRGYAPAPVRTGHDTEGIVAFGAELANCFCVGRGRKAFLSQHIGDLKGLETTLFYEETLERFIQLFRVKPSLLAVDLHPDYISTKTAARFPGVPVTGVQHHHAHIASCMTEHRLDESVIGVAFDGTGFGDDGHTWGSEFLVCDLKDYRRMAHFGYLPLPGGDSASEEPWRMAVSWLYKVFGKEFTGMDLPVIHQNRPEDISMLLKMIDRKINSPLTSGAGRIFDAVASVLGLCQVAEFPAQGPMLLESLVLENCQERYDWDGEEILNLDDILKGILLDIERGITSPVIATKFHNTVISVIFETVSRIRQKVEINKVVLSGGVFQNKYLLEGVDALLRKNKFEVFIHAAVPSNDGGIALGQLAVAAKRRELKCV
jgi:hydrogenase maturation protein HypF